MAGLKELRTRIGSIKSTQKITSAMKMVAAARLRRSQELLLKSKTYNDGILTVAGRIYKNIKTESEAKGVIPIYPFIMRHKAKQNKYLLVVFSSDRGLCGSFNAYMLRETLKRIKQLQTEGKEVKVLCIGKKIADALKRRCPDVVYDVLVGVGSGNDNYREAQNIAEMLFAAYGKNEFDVCEVIYTYFHSAINRDIKYKSFLPFELDIDLCDAKYDEKIGNAFYGYDDHKEKVFDDVVSMVAVSEMFQILLNSQTSEQGARMTSMDNATRNAKDMIAKLTLKYNRLRQGAITTELIEIIAGAEAL